MGQGSATRKTFYAFAGLKTGTGEPCGTKVKSRYNFFLIALFITQLEQSSVELCKFRGRGLKHRQRLNIPLAADN